MNKEKTKAEILNGHIDTAWKAYLEFLIEHDLPLPKDMVTAKVYFRGGFVYCMATYYKDVMS